MDKYFYKAKSAQSNYEYALKDARQGVNLNTTELFSIAHTIKPLIEQGQSIYTILENHKEIDICSKTLYTYIEMGLFNDLGINNLSLKRKTKRKIRCKKLKKRSEPADYTGRKYEDYLNFIKEHSNIPTTEMDTIYNNSSSGPFIQTFIFQSAGLMIGKLQHLKNVESMSSTLNEFQEILGNDYSKLFSLILTDRGSEFAKPRLFEVNSDTGEIRTSIFYCDPPTTKSKISC